MKNCIHVIVNKFLQKKFLFVIFFFQLAISNSFAGEPQSDFQKANYYYKKSDYENAIKTYEQLLSESNAPVEIYYNLGNCYYKTGNTARSILNYERALKLNSNDEDVNFNLRIAQLKVADRIEPLPEIFYMRWLHFIVAWMPLHAWTETFIACFWLLFMSAAWYVLAISSFAKRMSFAFILFFMVLSICTFSFTQQSHIEKEENKSAIITSASVYVKSSPDEKGNDLFILHEGTKVNVLDELGEWKKIRIANGTVGWMKGSEIEEI
jgi:tetratricopeptide (TPR) repeat protein